MHARIYPTSVKMGPVVKSFLFAAVILLSLLCSTEARDLEKRETTDSMNPGELLEGLGQLFEGAASVVGTLLNIKKNTIDPVVETIDRAGEYDI